MGAVEFLRENQEDKNSVLSHFVIKAQKMQWKLLNMNTPRLLLSGKHMHKSC